MTWLNNVPPFHPNVVVIRFRSAVPNLGSSSSRSLLFNYGLPAFRNPKMLHNLAWLASHDLYVAQTWQVRQILRIWTKKEVAAISVVKAPKMPQFSPPRLISKVLAKTPLGIIIGCYITDVRCSAVKWLLPETFRGPLISHSFSPNGDAGFTLSIFDCLHGPRIHSDWNALAFPFRDVSSNPFD
jgi:hypothetical protein